MEKVSQTVITYLQQHLGLAQPHCSVIAHLVTGGYVLRVSSDAAGDSERYIVRVGMPKDEAEYLVSFSRHFSDFGVSLARIVAYEPALGIVIQEDLGNTSLLELVVADQKEEGRLSSRVEGLYQQALRELVVMQIPAGQKLIADYAGRTVPFDREKILEDLVYFSDYFVPHLRVDSAAVNLASEFEQFATYLDRLPREYFYYRDLNTRNIFIKNERCYFLDVVGGRKGFTGCLTSGLEPSVLSLVNHARAGLSVEIRERLLSYYLSEVERYVAINREQFMQNWHDFALLKLLQVLGWYGKIGIVGGDQRAVASIPAALEELRAELSRGAFPTPMPGLCEVVKRAYERYSLSCLVTES
jgi:aminoglycoside/choline kinase family phosphotransferase